MTGDRSDETRSLGHDSPLPERGRVVRTERRVRVGDTDAAGRLRLDALARYLQDIAYDDSADAGLATKLSWVVRRMRIEVREWPAVTEPVALATWCGGIGSHFAERRSAVWRSADGVGGPDLSGPAAIEASALWVCIDAVTGRPLRLGDDFRALYAEAADGRTARSRLRLGAPTADALAAARPWPLRTTDLDLIGHVNNAVYWAAVEDVLAEAFPGPWPPLTADIEFPSSLASTADVRVAVAAPPTADTPLDIWVLDNTTVAATIRLTPG